MGKRFENFWEFNSLSARHLITRYYALLHVFTIYGGKRFENFWEFNWLSASHLITRYYALLHVITRYYSLLRFMGEKDLKIYGNLIGSARVILLPVITRYYVLWGKKI